jgi:sugar (pentulose or hexulose) kinase
MIGAGTAWVLLAVSDKRKVPVTENAFVCHHVSEHWGQIVSLVNGGSSLTWALELMGFSKRSSGEIEQLLRSAPAGSDGVSFRPFMVRAGGEGVASDIKGSFAGLQLTHQPAHLARAVVEGLAFELKRHLSFLVRGGVPVKNLVMGGATAASRVTTQIVADVTGLPLKCFPDGAGSAFGAAILARGLAETDRSLAELSDEMILWARAVRPDKNQSLYADRFEEYVAELGS